MAEEEKKEKKKDDDSKKMWVIIGAVILLAVGTYLIVSKNYQKYQLKSAVEEKITQTPDNPTDSSMTPSEELTADKWTWVNTQMSDGAEILPSTEGSFGLTFQNDMRVLATTDCNNGNGSYELGPDSAMTIGPMATTMMFCETSTEQQFYQGLNNVGSYKIDNGQLWLMLKMDSGTMIFE